MAIPKYQNLANDILEEHTRCFSQVDEDNLAQQLEEIVKDEVRDVLQEIKNFINYETFRCGTELFKVDKKIKEIAKRKGVEVE